MTADNARWLFLVVIMLGILAFGSYQIWILWQDGEGIVWFLALIWAGLVGYIVTCVLEGYRAR